jgi:hypothetical protein
LGDALQEPESVPARVAGRSRVLAAKDLATNATNFHEVVAFNICVNSWQESVTCWR